MRARPTVGPSTVATVCLLLHATFSLQAGEPIQIVGLLAGGRRVLAECQNLVSAQAKLRELKAQRKLASPIEVVLSEGEYCIAQPLRFVPEDSGTAQAPITYRAVRPGAVTISGGMRITGWQPEDSRVWRAEIPEVRKGTLYFRQLFVDGRRAIRARSPNRGFFHTTGLIKRPSQGKRKADGFYHARNDLTPEIVGYADTMLIVYQSWLSRQYRVKEWRPETKAVLLEPKMDVMRSRSRFLVENAPACLDAPGEWHLDRQTGVVRYLPRRGEDLHKATVTVPVTPSLLQFKGDPEQGAYVEHLHFKGLTFACSDWTPQGRSISGGQARCPTGFETPDIALESGAISAIGLRYASLEDCEIDRVGAHAITLLQGCAHNLIRKCHLHDLGGGGVYLYWAIPQPDKRASWRPRGEYDHITHNVIDNCFIHDLTRVFNGSVGVLTGPCAAFNRITHNEICYGDYSGISVGWGWSANQKHGYYQGGNVVDYNHVHHVMNYLLDDGGGIYLLGWQKGARICHNWVHDVRHDLLGHGAKGIYPDQGTSGVLFEGNVVHDVVQGFGGNGGHECIVRDNVFAFCQKSGVIGGSKWFHEQVRYNPHPVVFERNIVYGGDGMLMRTGYGLDAQTSRHNVYWPGAARLDAELCRDADGKPMAFADWQGKGHDVESIVADPLFVDAAKRDLRLRADSPALKMGFRQTDLSKVGLYGDPAWTSLPRETRHAPIVPLPGPGGFEWTYEHEAAGAKPVHSGQLAPGPAELGHKIEVTDGDAASGKHYLKLVEGKNSERSFYPFLHYPIGVDAGSVRASFRLKMPSAHPSAMYLSFRDYHNTGGKYFQTGPKLEIDARGVLTATGSSAVALKLPRDVWNRFGMGFRMGRGQPKTFDLTVEIPGQEPRAFRDIPYVDIGFMQVGDIYIVSTGPDGGAFFLDDVRVSAAPEDE